jgi:hypothetical protein
MLSLMSDRFGDYIIFFTKTARIPTLWVGMNGSVVFVNLKGACPFVTPKEMIHQREVKSRLLGGVLHYVIRVFCTRCEEMDEGRT